MIQYKLINKEYLLNRYSLFKTPVINFYSRSLSYQDAIDMDFLSQLGKITIENGVFELYPKMEILNNYWIFTFNLNDNHFRNDVQSLSIGFKNCYSTTEDNQIDFAYINCDNAFGVSTEQLTGDIESSRYREQLLQYGTNTIIIDAHKFNCKVLDATQIVNDTNTNMQDQLKQKYEYYNRL